MAVTAATEGPERLVERVQDLQSRLSAAGDETTRQLAEELVSAIVQMYGAGLEQVLGVLFAAGEEGARLAMTMADDPLVGTLFMIHDLHPVPLADRVDRALEHVRPYMESHGGNVELLSLQDGVARLRLEGSCSCCPPASWRSPGYAAPSWSWPTSKARCWPIATAAPAAAVRCTRERWSRARCTARTAAAATSCRGRAGRWTRTGCSWSRFRCCASTAP